MGIVAVLSSCNFYFFRIQRFMDTFSIAPYLESFFPVIFFSVFIIDIIIARPRIVSGANKKVMVDFSHHFYLIRIHDLQFYKVLYTLGNFNNHIGVPKTLLRLTAENDIAVIEMGANHPGEIKTLVNIVEPDYGIITNVGKAHLKGFGSFEGVIRTKGELYDYLREHNGTVFIHNDNEHLLKISSGLSLIKYGTTDSDELSVCGEFLSCDPFLNFRWRHGKAQWNEVRTHMIGSYNIYNMLAAACIGLYFDVTEEQICHALANYVPTNNRSELEVTANNKLIIDAYNANPTSMEAALKNFKEIKADHKMAIIGAMKELGEVSDEEHQKVADMLKALDIEQVWLVGDEFKSTNCTFRKFNNVEEVKQAIDENKPEGFCILIKGSNSTKLYELKTKL